MALHSFALQQAIFTALDGATINDADGNAITGVFDDVPENTAYPYVVIGEEKATNIDTKDKKGNPAQFSFRINVDLIIVDKFAKTLQINFNEKKSYNNKEKKFELKRYESILIQNMSEKILSDIIIFFQNLS